MGLGFTCLGLFQVEGWPEPYNVCRVGQNRIGIYGADTLSLKGKI